MPRLLLDRTDRWPGAGTVTPQFATTFETFRFAHDGATVITMYRPKSIAGMVWDVGGRARADLTPLAELSDTNLRCLSNASFSIAGHLIAVALTGVDAPENLAPVSTRTNQRMTSVEGEIRKLAQAPKFLEVSIPAYYDGADEDARIPKQFVYKLYTGPDRSSLVKEWTVDQAWLSPLTYTYPAKSVTLLGQMRAATSFLGWKIEDVTCSPIGSVNLSFLKGKLPPLDQRPNACMDFLLIERRGGGLFDEELILNYVRSIALGAGFPEATRSLALQSAILRNNNRLVSDAVGKRHTTLDIGTGVVAELFGTLIEGGGANAPQVDHIVPEARGGPNCFSNAQITSAHYNSTKGMNVATLAYRDDAWKAAMRAKMLADPALAPWV